MRRVVSGTWLVDGPIEGEVLCLGEPLSFWGGFDSETGTIIDRSHPQVGASLAGRVVAMPGSKGSSGTPGVLGDSIRRGTGPVGLLVTKADINLVAGAVTAEALYGRRCPILLVAPSDLAALIDGEPVVSALEETP